MGPRVSFSRLPGDNNGHIAERVKELLKEASVSVKSFVLEETHLFLKIISDEIVDRDSGLKAGVMIGNSEVGIGSISVEPFVFDVEGAPA